MARRFEGRERQRVSWDIWPGSLLHLTADATTIFGGTVPFGQGFTIRRIRGAILLCLEGTLAALDHTTIAVGAAVVSTDAAEAGAGSMPDPLADAEYPWLWYWTGDLYMPGASTSATWVNPTLGLAAVRLVVDSKAQRRVKNKESLVMVVQHASLVGAPPILASMSNTRLLLGQH